MPLPISDKVVTVQTLQQL